MKDRIKERIIKIFIVTGIIGAIGVFLPCIIVWFAEYSKWDKELDIIVYSSMGIWFISGAILMILLFMWGGIQQKPVKAEKFKLSCNEFAELKTSLEESLQQKKYILKKEVPVNNQTNVTVYVRNNRMGWLECFSLIRVDKWTNEVEEIIDNELEKLVEQYCNEGKRYRKISMIIVVCVKRITPAFQKLVNGNIQQGLNQFRLPVGISFGGKQIYVAKQKDGFAIMQYTRLRKEFLDIMGIEEK